MQSQSTVEISIQNTCRAYKRPSKWTNDWVCKTGAFVCKVQASTVQPFYFFFLFRLIKAEFHIEIHAFETREWFYASSRLDAKSTTLATIQFNAHSKGAQNGSTQAYNTAKHKSAYVAFVESYSMRYILFNARNQPFTSITFANGTQRQACARVRKGLTKNRVRFSYCVHTHYPLWHMHESESDSNSLFIHGFWHTHIFFLLHLHPSQASCELFQWWEPSWKSHRIRAEDKREEKKNKTVITTMDRHLMANEMNICHIWYTVKHRLTYVVQRNSRLCWMEIRFSNMICDRLLFRLVDLHTVETVVSSRGIWFACYKQWYFLSMPQKSKTDYRFLFFFSFVYWKPFILWFFTFSSFIFLNKFDGIFSLFVRCFVFWIMVLVAQKPNHFLHHDPVYCCHRMDLVVENEFDRAVDWFVLAKTRTNVAGSNNHLCKNGNFSRRNSKTWNKIKEIITNLATIWHRLDRHSFQFVFWFSSNGHGLQLVGSGHRHTH